MMNGPPAIWWKTYSAVLQFFFTHIVRPTYLLHLFFTEDEWK